MGEATGSLTIVGTGIKAVRHCTIEAHDEMKNADILLYLVADPIVAMWIHDVKPDAEPLHRFYGTDKPRIDTYHEIVDRIMTCVRTRKRVCVAFYGHPGVFVYPAHKAISQARSEGYSAELQPGISAEDCLFADLGIDPGNEGCQSFEATDFLIYKRRFDPHVALILWQIAVIGDLGYNPDRVFNEQGLDILIENLSEVYGPEHEVIVYEAAQYPVCRPIADKVPLAQLATARISGISTLYVPPIGPQSADKTMLERLKLIE
jgi:uncharacterized protein YabN with tetrapyrrole methylase and pyrophosphatase domain